MVENSVFSTVKKFSTEPIVENKRFCIIGKTLPKSRRGARVRFVLKQYGFFPKRERAFIYDEIIDKRASARAMEYPNLKCFRFSMWKTLLLGAFMGVLVGQ